MAFLNENYLKLKAGYLFPEIARRVANFTYENKEAAARLIRCGIGDVTEALPAAARDAMKAAVDELGDRTTFRGYGPEQGYGFLREAIVANAYEPLGCKITADEIFISDGSKCDTGSILDIFGHQNRIAITDPVYPVYVDTNVMCGNTGDAAEDGSHGGLVYLPCRPSNNFVPQLPAEKVDLIYLCYPNNPTGATASFSELVTWVDFARANQAIILFDAAYEAYITEPGVPHSIFEIEGAKDCAIEFRSFSKHGGFTGVRCAYTVVPRDLLASTEDGKRHPLHPLWARRQSTKFNGVSYPVQRGAEALFSEQGKKEVQELITHYLGNATILREACIKAGLDVYGGVNAPYIWVACPEGVKSWELFDRMLNEANVVITPGAGFGTAGEGYFRISAFNSRANAEEVARRIAAMKW
ncbi:MAG: LL-diaminopimelate aminotransferase [Verrucomicrobiaceae bacterium]|nr:MAG: LL-diaminopimelate aminotransferase [Verrucomicrobiaceae bacterium]